jgi:hypothetical protein
VFKTFWLAFAAVTLVVFFSIAAFAQTVHPCDQPIQTVATKGSRVGFCHDLRDDEGFTLPASAVGFRLSVNGQVADLGSLTPVGTPSASGSYYFVTDLPGGFSRGTFPVAVAAYTAEGTSAASNIALWQRGGPPNRPTNTRIAWWLRGVKALASIGR